MIQDIYPHKLDNQYDPSAEPDENSIILYFTKEGVLNRQEKAVLPAEERVHRGDGTGTADPTWLNTESRPIPEEALENVFDTEGGDMLRVLEFPHLSDFAAAADIEKESLIYLFSVDDEKYFLLRQLPDSRAEENSRIPGMPSGFVFTPVRSLRDMEIGPKHRIFACITALQLYNWYRKNRFCGCCGAQTVHDRKERAIRCPQCGNLIYPRIVPAVIVGVRNGDKLLVTKYRTGFRHYALVAGFTEIGETLEETVAREVMEETGLRVKNIRYYKSQPWGIVDDILMGFYCDADGDAAISMDQNELKLAEWKTREEIVLQPDDFSLTNEMMQRFKFGGEC